MIGAFGSLPGQRLHIVRIAWKRGRGELPQHVQVRLKLEPAQVANCDFTAANQHWLKSIHLICHQVPASAHNPVERQLFGPTHQIKVVKLRASEECLDATILPCERLGSQTVLKSKYFTADRINTHASAGCFAELAPIDRPLAILDLEQISRNGDEDDVLKAVAQSVLVASPAKEDGWRKPEYAFSRFIADCAIADGFHAIRYGSTREAEGGNVVFLSPPADISGLVRLASVRTLIRK